MHPVLLKVKTGVRLMSLLCTAWKDGVQVRSIPLKVNLYCLRKTEVNSAKTLRICSICFRRRIFKDV